MVLIRTHQDFISFLEKYDGPESYNLSYNRIEGKNANRKLLVGKVFPRIKYELGLETPLESIVLLYRDKSEYSNPVSANKIELVLSLKKYLDMNEIEYEGQNRESVKRLLQKEARDLIILSKRKSDLSKIL